MEQRAAGNTGAEKMFFPSGKTAVLCICLSIFAFFGGIFLLASHVTRTGLQIPTPTPELQTFENQSSQKSVESAQTQNEQYGPGNPPTSPVPSSTLRPTLIPTPTTVEPTPLPTVKPVLTTVPVPTSVSVSLPTPTLTTVPTIVPTPLITPQTTSAPTPTTDLH